MNEFLTAAVGLILMSLAVGLVRVLRGPGDADRMMAAQLVGTCGIAALLIVGVIGATAAAIDVALVLALLAAFAGAAFAGAAFAARAQRGPAPDTQRKTESR
ncbi:monovalent cation/H+ antiporter complex subunit F [Rhodoplanes azumiensis]|uniref:Monovalent cation/H+ antiporter complex subunit F n=1 Tax=Rhodoplanes azumiensis TaxID=1897628 RepID=A0ABW5AKK0_9BRAD